VIRPLGTRVDHYELLNLIGSGGQADVYHAKDVRDGSEVVVKFPLAGILNQPVLAARWRRETAITQGLRHPRIVCRHDAGERHGEPYIVLEYVGGGTLRGWISTPDDPLAIDQAVAWGRQVVEALAFLHDRAIIHRDVKPDNVLVGADSTVKLGDFGAAISVRSRRRSVLSLPPAPEGTAAYACPEQLVGQPSDARSDIYGWGILMYELLAGALPFSSPDPLAAMTAHLHDEPVPLRQARPDVTPALEAVVMTAMRRHPDHRYANVGDLRADLDRLDTLDAATFDLTAEEPITDMVGGNEPAAMLRLALFGTVGFLTISVLAILLTVVLR
jgi:eukaryotic-like serine/threonine-protein kinase